MILVLCLLRQCYVFLISRNHSLLLLKTISLSLILEDSTDKNVPKT